MSVTKELKPVLILMTAWAAVVLPVQMRAASIAVR
jgi:hypothetical protein